MQIQDHDGVAFVVLTQEQFQALTEHAELIAGGDGWSSWRRGDALVSQEGGRYVACPNYFLMDALLTSLAAGGRT